MNEAKEVVDKVADFLNTFGDSKRINEFVKEMENQHRTLQQSFTRLCVAWLKRLAEPGYHYDDRNKASVRLAEFLKDKLEEAYLPLI